MYNLLALSKSGWTFMLKKTVSGPGKIWTRAMIANNQITKP